MPTENLTLRSAGAEDEAFLYQVYASTRHEEMQLVDWSADQKESFLRMQFQAQHTYYHAQFPEASYQLVLWDSVPVGRLYVERRAHETAILDIALLSAYRNRGLGSTLLKELLAEADRTGKRVRIHVERFNPALRLYRRLDFTPIDEEGVYFLMERLPQPVHLLPEAVERPSRS